MLLWTMNPVKKLGQQMASLTKWAYDAVVPSIKRQQPTGVLRSEDAELTRNERAKLVSAGRDLHRNFALLGWAVRKHLDYVSTFKFQAKGADEKKNNQIEAFVAKWSNRKNFDAAQRHNLQRFLRLLEQRRTIDGDVFVYKLANGRVQAIEGDRIRSPLGGVVEMQNAIGQKLADGTKVVHGVVIGEFGEATGYMLSRRTGSFINGQGATQFTYERTLPAEHVYHHAYWDRFDQTRGISPLAAVYNTLRDVYESFDYALAKMKLSQLLGLVFYRDAADSVGDLEEDPNSNDADGTAEPKYKVDFGKNIFKLELDGGDRAEFLESKNPSNEFQQFSQTMIALILKAFDIPYSFYAENFSNYSGSRQALLQYEMSAEQRRCDNRDLLNELTAWRLKMAIDDGDPDLAGVTVEDLRWEWVAAALPWIDPVKETAANAMAVDRGFTSTPRVCKEQGGDAWEIAKEEADFRKKVHDYYVNVLKMDPPVWGPVSYTEVLTAKEPSNATAA